jgi:uncharacterized protein YjaZ
MAVALHVLDADGQLEPIRDSISRAFHAALVAIRKHLAVDTVDVVVRSGERVIPDIGMVGFCRSVREVSLTVNPASPAAALDFDRNFTSTLAHELHHAMRRRGPGYGTTLWEALVTEGLACQFEAQVVGRLPSYAVPANAEVMAAALARARSEGSQNYSHEDWFFGKVSTDSPRGIGYRLGTDIVGRVLRARNLSAGALWAEPASGFQA